MQSKIFAVLAFAAVAHAQFPPACSDIPNASLISAVLPVIPASAITNPTGFAQDVASSFQAGETPTWFSMLPSDIQSCFAAGAIATEIPSSIMTVTGDATIQTSTVVSTDVMTSTGESTTATITEEHTSTMTDVVSSETETDSAAEETSTSTGGAALPTAVIGAGVAGALGFLGMIAL
ncbi:hypothetical protein M501DRAFT_998822 [Patellaria atrata CBS 101060]|uniref:GPI anchored protein n=1 Tax=Patellaria atrata CBS 101060 TaxID=1346257 RepID=A0A9P4SIL9_9PEZI|nr:hypothetical protein M501DRAFT_998822 [Patellaria atrata CBS 101060]